MLMSVLFWGAGLGLAALWASLAATLLYFRRSSDEAPGDVLAMTLIKPVRGLDENLPANLASIGACDPGGSLQVIVAMETMEDPAFAAAQAFARAHPGRDYAVLLTGPSGARMGKIHNMIEAFRHARHPRVIFSDADVTTTPALLQETSRAFREGWDAVFALPIHQAAPGLGGWQFMVAFNHFFALGAALVLRFGRLRHCAGAWMGYTKAILERAGGLEQFRDVIADDFAVSRKVAAGGGRLRLIRAPAPLLESDPSPVDAFRHLCKWAAIIRCAVPWAYFLAPLTAPGVVAAFAVAASGGAPASWKLLGAAMLSRPLIALIHDRAVLGVRMAWWGYPLMTLCDFGMLVYWVAGFKSTVLWRGKRYRLKPGGTVEVLK